MKSVSVFVIGRRNRSHAGIWVTPLPGSVLCRRAGDLDAIAERDTLDDFGVIFGDQW